MPGIDPTGTRNPWKESGFYSEDKGELVNIFKERTSTVCNVIYSFKIFHFKI